MTMANAFRRSGFSLVELLTVIAIIAILAAIIFPVMGAVKRRAQENQCMTNLHQIALGVQMYKNDNRTYPRILGSQVRTVSGTPWSGTGDRPRPFEQVKDKYLFSEYVKSIGAFHCPTSRISNDTDVVAFDATSGTDELLVVYAYDSYDAYVPVSGRQVYWEGLWNDSAVVSGSAQRHYMTSWAESVDWLKGADAPKPYPPSIQRTDEELATLAADDYARQLKFRNPPGDTVVTWCSYHQTSENDGTGKVQLTGKALVVFLDGHADQIPAGEMAVCKWRVRPKKT
jgi:prepilin-type N-terminal cleavage/methylation domain-containing protein